MEQLNLHVGYKFSPTQSELLVHYLLNKILGRNLPANVIPTFDCFSCSPDRLPLQTFNFKYGKPNEWYFFTSGREGQIVSTEDGYYKFSGEKTEYEGDKVIGYIRSFKFYHGIPSSGIESRWVINEFRLHPDLLRNHEQQGTNSTVDSNLVVCKLVRLQTTTGCANGKF